MPTAMTSRTSTVITVQVRSLKLTTVCFIYEASTAIEKGKDVRSAPSFAHCKSFLKCTSAGCQAYLNQHSYLVSSTLEPWNFTAKKIGSNDEALHLTRAHGLEPIVVPCLQPFGVTVPAEQCRCPAATVHKIHACPNGKTRWYTYKNATITKP